MSLRKIHRIYFGFDGRPDPYLAYLENWKEMLPDYEVCLWDATNLPLSCCQFSREMLKVRDHAFLSDYFRWWVLREHGGIYLDADIEIIDGDGLRRLIENLESTPNLHAIIGIDNKAGGWYTGHSMASKKNGAYARFMCEVYESFGAISVWRRNIFCFMSPQLSALYFSYHGHNVEGMGTSPNLEEPRVLEGVKIFPQEFFSPMTPSSENGVSSFIIDAYTEKTVLCHHFSCSWHSKDSPYRLAKGTQEIKAFFLRDLVREGRFAAPDRAIKRKGMLERILRIVWRCIPKRTQDAIRNTIIAK